MGRNEQRGLHEARPSLPRRHPKLFVSALFGGIFVGTMVLFCGFGWTLFAVSATFTTEWAPGYSELEFRRIERGETREQVLARLGEPFQKSFEGSLEEWEYSRPKGEAHHWLRVVRFDGSGRVESTRHELNTFSFSD